MPYENYSEKELSLKIEDILGDMFGNKRISDRFYGTSGSILGDFEKFWDDFRLYAENAIQVDKSALNRFFDECIRDKQPDKETLIHILDGLKDLEENIKWF